MTLHNKPEYNSPATLLALRAHGFSTDDPSMLADAFRLGRASAALDWKPQRCAECTCEAGGAECNWIKPGPNILKERSDG